MAKKVQILQEIPCVNLRRERVNAEGPQRFCGNAAERDRFRWPPSLGRREGMRPLPGNRESLYSALRVCSGEGWIGRKRTVTVHIPPGVNDHCRLYLPGWDMREGPRASKEIWWPKSG